MLWTTEKLRRSFLDYFASKSHRVVNSSSVVPYEDDTLLFTNSGMVQFKKNLLGERSELRRACSVQRCIRAGGKHNDLDDVGKDTYHHTYFEMLGNWSFGDYFKEEAIGFAWEFLVEVLKLSKDKLYVTYYDELDKESRRIWLKYLPSNRIIPASYKDNFWEMGDTGPCGPCTEIHYDRIGNRNASELVNKDDPNVIEIWNIVFIEYNRTASGLTPLERKCIDTGIGLERLLSILIDVKSNYLIDSFSTIIKAIEEHCDFKYEDSEKSTDVAFRVISDHCRTIAVCIYDKVDFSNDGVGYVLRRILRRAVRYAHEVLGLKEGVLEELVKIAAGTIGIDLESTECVSREEALFMKTLKKGIERFNKIAENNGKISGEDLFLLYDTYGFPVDLTELMAREKNIEIDYTNFESFRQRAIEVSKKSKGTKINIDGDILSKFPPTNDSFKYERNNMNSTVLFAVVGNDIITDPSEIPEGVELGLVFDKTCFYAECGGQVGDTGKITFYCGEKSIGTFNVTDTQAVKKFVVHKGILEGNASYQALQAYNSELRRRTMRNHTGTHLLNFFLRTIIKTEQRGSLVDPEKLRFDFEGRKLTNEELEEVEKKINEFIKSNAKVESVILDRCQALENSNIVRMRNEEYPEKVRVITMKSDGLVIEEMCGGTHVTNVSDVGRFRIVNETGVSANTRRIVGVTGKKAQDLDEEAELYLSKLNIGEVVNVDKAIPLLYKQKIDALNQKNRKRGEELSKAQYSKNKKEFVELIAERKSAPDPDARSIVYYYQSSESCTRKDLAKFINLLCSEAVKHEIECIVYTFINEECLIAANTSDNGDLINRINSKYPNSHVRTSKGMVQGSIHSKITREDAKDLIS
ncbi:alanyl-tRNA synthethase [Encephalitozoon hellem]|uniref:Alanine--tRNA ligase n=1 Tax=Encephalitozoon hellem TaxID=27973 RepID=A0ABY8CGY1_ENCHE|nr:alanyl-tRNA synthethase [Encephalitozoon hellem]